ncbi:hypothetical protein LABF186_19830 [Lactobacillus amylovorus subsp. animalium]|uniref:GmrSD restriction endonucleases N-terminal domain-containing protein n=1 Tax=Lactobacillus amylovorus subsp. animalium TaxID=3378536 RepID=A0ABD0C6E6_LACAM|nr:hypothetical protein LABF186_19830 [Lactobacillus amylovorus]GMM15054.1 hypothetical protein LABF125_01870 [Lactobacillus amylovorus]
MDENKKKKARNQIDKLQQEVSYDTRDYPIEYLVQNYESRKFFRPRYQRNELVWDERRQARFIESLLLGYPIPMLFLADTDEGKLEIVDGLQRISTLVSFMQNKLILEKLEKLTDLNGFKFKDLPESEKNRFPMNSLRVIVLRKNTDEKTKIDLFNRINTSSLQANDAEVRSGVEILNPFMQLINKLSNDKTFLRLIGLSAAKLKRKENVELASRFFAYSHEYKNFKHSVRSFVNSFIEKSGEKYTVGAKEDFEKEFKNTFKFIDDFYPKDIFHNNGIHMTPRVRFEAISVGTNLALKKDPKLKIRKEDVLNMVQTSEFKEYTTSDASNSRPKIIKRIEFVENYLLENGIR